MSENNGKTLDLKAVEVDPARLTGGSWFEVWREPDGSLDGRVVDKATEGPCVLIVPYGIAYDRVRDEELRPYAERLRAGKVTDEDIRGINGRVLGRTTFRGCQNLQIGGEPVVWSEAKAIELMTDDRWIRLRELVQRKAADKAAAAAREEAQASGN